MKPSRPSDTLAIHNMLRAHTASGPAVGRFVTAFGAVDLAALQGGLSTLDSPLRSAAEGRVEVRRGHGRSVVGVFDLVAGQVDDLCGPELLAPWQHWRGR
mgnify:FL=1